MAARGQTKTEPVNSFQLVGYTLHCWPQNHFYSSNLIDILGEYNIKTFEARSALAQYRRQGYLEYCRRPPGLWRIRKKARESKVPLAHMEIYKALILATKANIDARLAAIDKAPEKIAPPPGASAPAKIVKTIDYYHLAAAALQIWPCNHLETTQLADYCNQFQPADNAHHKGYRNRQAVFALIEDRRLWQSPVHGRLLRITLRGRMGGLGTQGPEVLEALRTAPPTEAPPGKDYLLAWALAHPGEWQIDKAVAWIADQGAVMPKWKVIDFLKRLEKRLLVERLRAGINHHQPSAVYCTRPALYDEAGPDLTLWEQLLRPEGGELAGRCYPDGRPDDLPQVGKVAPELADDVTVAASVVPAEQGLAPDRRPGSASIISLKGVVLDKASAPVKALARGELSNTDIVAGLVDYIVELRAGAGVSEVARLRRSIDTLNGALQKVRGRATSQESAIRKLNAIKENLEGQVKELSSQLAAANNRLQEARSKSRPPVRTYRDKGSGFGLGEVATFKGRRLPNGQTPIISKKRA